MKEFELIELIKKKCQSYSSKSILGIGDDCAILPYSDSYHQIITTDSLVEGIHYSREYFSPQDIGWKTLAVNLSDIAAMGGVPQFAVISLGLSSTDWVEGFYDGLLELAEKFQVEVVGGNISQASQNWINLTLTGVVEKEQVKCRDQSSGSIWISGNLGYSALGLKQLQNDPNHKSKFVDCHLRPQPRIEEGRALSQRSEVLSMMDISDGFYTDLMKLNRTQKFKIDFSNLEIDPEFLSSCQNLNLDPFQIMMEGGEDYELLFIADDMKECHFDFKCLGHTIEENQNLILDFEGNRVKSVFKGFDHLD